MAPFEQTRFDWRGGLASRDRAGKSSSAGHYADAAFAPAREILSGYDTAPDANLDHPYFARTTPRTMLIDEMEAIWAPIADEDDWSAFNKALAEIDEMAKAYANRRQRR